MGRSRVHERGAAVVHDQMRGREPRTHVVHVDRGDARAEIGQFRGDATPRSCQLPIEVLLEVGKEFREEFLRLFVGDVALVVDQVRA